MRTTRTICCISLVTLLCFACKPITKPVEAPTAPLEGDSGLVVVWRGFTHAWTHNHRWNRFGNWAQEKDDCDEGRRCYELGHSAASGTSGDSATFETHYTAVQAPGVGFTIVSSSQELQESYGSEGLWTIVGTAWVDSEKAQDTRLKGRENYTAFLSGWDLYSNPGYRAAKPIDFGLEVGDPIPDESTGNIMIPWRVYLVMNCSTEECPGQEEDQISDYTVRVQIGILGYDGTDISVTGPQQSRWNQAWNAPPNALGHGTDSAASELVPSPSQGTFSPAQPDALHVPAFRRVMMHLYHTLDGIENADQHMLEWHSTVALTGRGAELPYTVDLFFKNWTEGMTRYQLFAYKDAGAALMTADVVLLEFQGDTSSQDGTWTGGIEWGGADQSAASEDAVVRSSEAAP